MPLVWGWMRVRVPPTLCALALLKKQASYSIKQRNTAPNRQWCIRCRAQAKAPSLTPVGEAADVHNRAISLLHQSNGLACAS